MQQSMRSGSSFGRKRKFCRGVSVVDNGQTIDPAKLKPEMSTVAELAEASDSDGSVRVDKASPATSDDCEEESVHFATEII
jgi:hypothetical protein